MGKGFNLEMYIHRGAAAYICGEETGLIESLEGKRAWPRIKPPFPAIEGAFRKPTVVNNIETVACVTHIIDRGVDWFKSLGVPGDPRNPRDPGSYGPKLYCVSGHVNKPCCVELPMGVTTRELVDKYAGGVWKGRKAKGSIPGGISMGIMTEAEFDIPLDFDGPGKVGCLGLGTSAVTIFDDHTSIADVTVQRRPLLRPRVVRPMHPVPRGLRSGCSRSATVCSAVARAAWRTCRSSRRSVTRSAPCPARRFAASPMRAGWPIKNAIRKFKPRAGAVHPQRHEGEAAGPGVCPLDKMSGRGATLPAHLVEPRRDGPCEPDRAAGPCSWSWRW